MTLHIWHMRFFPSKVILIVGCSSSCHVRSKEQIDGQRLVDQRFSNCDRPPLQTSWYLIHHMVRLFQPFAKNVHCSPFKAEKWKIASLIARRSQPGPWKWLSLKKRSKILCERFQPETVLHLYVNKTACALALECSRYSSPWRDRVSVSATSHMAPWRSDLQCQSAPVTKLLVVVTRIIRYHQRFFVAWRVRSFCLSGNLIRAIFGIWELVSVILSSIETRQRQNECIHLY